MTKIRTRPANDTYIDSARMRAESAYESALDGARAAGRRTAKGIESFPMAALAGGLALGAVAAAFLPKTARENALLGKTGRKINARAKDAAQAAKQLGRDQIGELGLTPENLRRKLDQFTDRTVTAAKGNGGKSRGRK